jgi:acyl-CoA thioester hydrolase
MTAPGGPVNRTHYRVLYGDVDQMGVMYYGHYYRLFERGRGEYIRDLGMSYHQIEQQGFMLPVTESHCHYHRSATYDDKVLIETRLGQVRRASLRFEYEVFRDDAREELLVTGHTVHACVASDTRAVVRLPEFLLKMLNGGG